MKNFLDYTDEKITEKAFMQSLVVSVVGILICIVSLCSITYAWFSGSVSSGNNVLKSGSFDLEIKAVDGTSTNVVFTKSSGVWSYEFNPGTYTVTLKTTDTSNVKGYCAITKDNGTTHINTEVMSKDTTDEYKETIKFTLEVSELTNITIKFSPRWGIPATQEGAPVIKDKCKVTVDSNGVRIETE